MRTQVFFRSDKKSAFTSFCQQQQNYHATSQQENEALQQYVVCLLWRPANAAMGHEWRMKNEAGKEGLVFLLLPSKDDGFFVDHDASSPNSSRKRQSTFTLTHSSLSLLHIQKFSLTLAIMPNPYVRCTTFLILSSMKAVQVTMSKARSSLHTLVVEQSFLLFGVTVIKLCQCWVPTQVDVTSRVAWRYTILLSSYFFAKCVVEYQNKRAKVSSKKSLYICNTLITDTIFNFR